MIRDYLIHDFIPVLRANLNDAFELLGDWFAYTPLNAEWTAWRTSDGTVLNVDIEELLMDYAFDDPEWTLGIDPEEFIDNYVV